MSVAGAGSTGAHGVRRTAVVLVRTAVFTVPSGVVRDRYRSEHLAELHALPEDQQLRYAAGAFSTSLALRAALLEGWDVTIAPSAFPTPLLCRLNLHHHWKLQRNSSTGEAYYRCTRCGKDHMGDPRGPNKIHPVAWGS
jgi:hypothetical protein